jgi:hypothetical protein
MISPPGAIQRRLAERATKQIGLESELAQWRELSEEGKPLQKHHSQIQRITAWIATMAKAGRNVLRDETLLQAHTIWDFFRTKIALRLDPWCGDHLRACDEFAWACYEPPQQAYRQWLSSVDRQAEADRIKEPPLVFLNGGWSPFAVSRRVAFRREYWGERWPKASKESLEETIDRFPLPLVGAPWSQVAHLPEALVIGHEMGHVVEVDFNLLPLLQTALLSVNVAPEHVDAWAAWLREIFADYYGCLTGGAMFAGALLDFLDGNNVTQSSGSPQPGAWGLYPPPWLRAELIVRTLEELGFTDEAKRLRGEWKGSWIDPPLEAPSWSRTTATLVAEAQELTANLAVLKIPQFSDQTFVELFNPEALLVVNGYGKNFAVTRDPGQDPRTAFALARWLHENDLDQTESGIQVRAGYYRDIRGAVVKRWNQTVGVRGTAPDQLEAALKADAAEAEAWLAKIQ